MGYPAVTTFMFYRKSRSLDGKVDWCVRIWIPHDQRWLGCKLWWRMHNACHATYSHSQQPHEFWILTQLQKPWLSRSSRQADLMRFLKAMKSQSVLSQWNNLERPFAETLWDKGQRNHARIMNRLLSKPSSSRICRHVDQEMRGGEGWSTVARRKKCWQVHAEDMFGTRMGTLPTGLSRCIARISIGIYVSETAYTANCGLPLCGKLLMAVTDAWLLNWYFSSFYHIFSIFEVAGWFTSIFVRGVCPTTNQFAMSCRIRTWVTT